MEGGAGEDPRSPEILFQPDLEARGGGYQPQKTVGPAS